MNHVKQIQAHVIRSGATAQTDILLDLLLGIPNVPYARRLLDSLPYPSSTFLCNKLLRVYSPSAANFHLCLSLFSSMHSGCQHQSPNLHSFTFMISACASSSRPCHGSALHALICKHGFTIDPFISTSLLNMYCKTGLLPSARLLFDQLPHRDVATWNSMITGYARSGDLDSARELFDAMPVRNVISWTSLISGYSQNERYEEAIEMYVWMRQMGEAWPNEVTLTSVLPACANVGAKGLGEKIEAYARENGLVGNVFVGSALVEMYAKCGDVDRAKLVFQEVGKRKNICSWNSMILGLAVHGRWKESLELFQEMKEKGITPDDITFTGVLTACSHGGLVEEGRHFFQSMEKEYSVFPKLQHYGCMVDLLGRAGLLKEAHSFIKKMLLQPDAVIWGALLGACSFYGNAELAEIAAEPLFELEPSNPGNYVILANIYASAGRWDCVTKVWKLMKGRQQKKAAGYSLVELDGSMLKFLVDDQSHPRSEEMYTLLHEIYTMMLQIGSDSNTTTKKVENLSQWC